MIQGFVVRQHVAGETVDGETIVIDFLTGAYHTLEGASAEVWAGLQSDSVIDPDDQQVAVLVALADAGLVEATGDVARNGHAADPTMLGITSYTDMVQLLLADPVHEVDERGWPILRKP